MRPCLNFHTKRNAASAFALAYGGDYNPEQWPETVWDEDVALMREAGVNLVTRRHLPLGAAGAAPGSYEFGWLDDVLDLLHGGGIASTSPPRPPRRRRGSRTRYPEIAAGRPPTASGSGRGGRQALLPELAGVPRARAGAGRAARRAGTATTPRVALWHVSQRVRLPQRALLLRRVGGRVPRLAAATGTATSTRSTTPGAPRSGASATPTGSEIAAAARGADVANPAQRLDFRRFSSDELLDCFRAERDVLRAHSPEHPGHHQLHGRCRTDEHGLLGVGAARWTSSPTTTTCTAEDPRPPRRAGVRRRPHPRPGRRARRGCSWSTPPARSTGSRATSPSARARCCRNSLQHVARGADGVLFFQWRASRAGAEKFHSAMLPHAGTDTRVWREVVELGADLTGWPRSPARRVAADVAILFDWEAWWACELDAHPASTSPTSTGRTPLHRALLGPGRHRRRRAARRRPQRLPARRRAQAVPRHRRGRRPRSQRTSRRRAPRWSTYFSGIVDEHDHVRLGGYPGAFRDLLGVRVEEFFPLREGEQVGLDDGSHGRRVDRAAAPRRGRRGGVVRRRAGARRPAVTRHRFGAARPGTSAPGWTAPPRPAWSTGCWPRPGSSHRSLRSPVSRS